MLLPGLMCHTTNSSFCCSCTWFNLLKNHPYLWIYAVLGVEKQVKYSKYSLGDQLKERIHKGGKASKRKTNAPTASFGRNKSRSFLISSHKSLESWQLRSTKTWKPRMSRNLGSFYPAQILDSAGAPSLRQAGKQTARKQANFIRSWGATEVMHGILCHVLHADFKIPQWFYVALLILSGIASVLLSLKALVCFLW